MEAMQMNTFRKWTAALLSLLLFLGCTVSAAEGDEWICPGCGAANATNFCTKCGTKKPEEIICPNCGEKYPMDSGTLFCGSCGTKLQQGPSFSIRYEGEGFDTPEEALTYYMEGLRDLNFEQMLGAFAWETQIEHYDLKAFLEHTGVYTSITYPSMPSLNDFIFSANVNATRADQSKLIYQSIVSYLLGKDSPANTGHPVSFKKDSDDIAVFLQQFDNGKLEKLSQMSNIRFLSPDEVTDGKFSNERNLKTFAKMTARYGADETVNLVGVADVGDETLYCFPTICRYGSKWYLVSLSSMTSNILNVSIYSQAFICGTGDLNSLIQ